MRSGMTPWDAGNQPVQPSLDHMLSTSTASVANTTITQVTGYARLLSNPGYFTYASGSMTMLQSGLYLLNASVSFANNVTGRRMVLIYVNGVEARRNDAGSGSLATPEVTHMARLAVGDVVDVRAYQSSGAALALSNAPGHDFQMARIGA